MIIVDSYKYKKYLLDRYPATVAFSLRKLKAGQSIAIRVRRSSDNAEQNIGFIGNELDTVSLLSFCGVGNGFVTTWYDQSGNARNAIQTTQANQPQIVSNGVVITDNGKPSIQFDGVNNDLRTEEFSFSTNNLSVLTVTKPTSSTQKNLANIIDHSHADLANGTWVIQQNSQDHNSFYFAPKFSDGYRLVTPTSIPFNTLSLIAYYMSVGSGQFLTYYRNGTQTANISTSSLTGISGRDSLIIGSNKYHPRQYNGRIQEVIIYDTNQTANRTAIESDINTRYSIY